MKIKRHKQCKYCNTEENLFTYKIETGKVYVSNICKDCSNKKSLERYHSKTQSYCSRCYNEKQPDNKIYCNVCSKNINSGNKFRKMDDDFTLDLWSFMKLLPHEPDYIQVLKIIDYWSTITLYPHLYWNKKPRQQIEYMIDDIILFLEGKYIKKN